MKWIIVCLLVAFSGACASDGKSNDLVYGDVERDENGEFSADPDYYADNAQRFFQAGDYRRSLTQFRHVVELRSEDDLARLGEAYCLYNIGKEQAARGAFDRAGTSFERAEAKFGTLWLERAGGDLEKSTLDAKGWHWKALLGLAETERAIASLAKLESDRIDQSLPHRKDREKIDAELAQQAKLRKRRDIYTRKSRERFVTLCAMDHPSPDCLVNLGDLELIVGNEPAAERAYVQYLDVAQRSVDVWDSRREEAVKNLKSKTELEVTLAAIDAKREGALKKTIGVLEQLAEIKFHKRNFTAALEYLERALDIDPDRYVLNVPIAECHYELGSYEKGLEYIDRYIRLTPEFDDDTHRAYKLRSKLVDGLANSGG